MSCIKFPSSKSDLLKPSNKENAMDYNKVRLELISAANKTFGEGKWSSSITNQSLDYIDYVAGKYAAGCSCVVRIQLPNENFHENIGYSSTEGSSKGSAIQKARLGSYNSAFKKTLMCFGKDITNKIIKTPSRPSSPMLIDVAQSTSLSIPNNCLPIEDNVHVETQQSSELFEDCIPMSQAAALMDATAFDQIIFDKKENSDSFNMVKTDKDEKNPMSNAIKTEPQVNVPRPSASSTGIANVVNKDSKMLINSAPKKDVKMEAPKPIVSTAMTEEEIRQERKRKQREMQEEFKRKEEFKKKMGDNGDNGSKPTPNPRY